MDVDVGEAVADDVVEKGDVEEAALHPVLGGVREYAVQDGHEDDVAREEDQQGVIAPGLEGVGELRMWYSLRRLFDKSHTLYILKEP